MLIFIFSQSYSQINSRFSIKICYGISGNFFVRSYDEQGGPANKTYFYKKNFIGTISGISATIKLDNYSSIFIEYNRSVNNGRKNYAGSLNGVDIYILDFQLRHINNFYLIGYELFLNKLKNIKADVGGVLIYDVGQTINIENWDNYLSIEQNDFKNSKSVQGGVFLGFEYLKKLDTKFSLGLKTRGYYLISTSSFEAITLTPTLTYHF
jgi:hypothetical protein